MWKLIIFAALAMVMIADAALHGQSRVRYCQNTPLELSFVVDCSNSIWKPDFDRCLQFVEKCVDSFEISPTVVRMSLVTFSYMAFGQTAFNFSDSISRERVKLKLSRVHYCTGYKTNISSGIWYMVRKQIPSARQGVRRVAFVMTDGGDSVSSQEMKKAADAARSNNVEVFALAIGDEPNTTELISIGGDRGHVLKVSPDLLMNITDKLNYTFCEPCDMDPVDLSLIIDSSSSIGETNFVTGMEFITDFVSHFEIGVGARATRVSAITFARGIYRDDAIRFGDYNNTADLIARLNKTEWQRGPASDTDAAIKYMRTVLMSPARSNVPHVCLIITDGRSTYPTKTVKEAEQARNDSIVMFVVGVGEPGPKLDVTELHNIAGDPSQVMIVTTYEDLERHLTELIGIMCRGVHARQRT